MPNLSLTHNGNMNITSAEITSAGTLNVAYGQNNTGAVTGFSFTASDDEFLCGNTYTFTGTPLFSGTVLSETFVVSGFDNAGIKRSDTSVLRQSYDFDLLHQDISVEVSGGTIVSSSITSSSLELEITIDAEDYAEIEITPGSGDTIIYPIYITPPPPPIILATSITLNVDATITDSGTATTTYSPTGATVSFVYSSSDDSIATIDPDTGEITVLANGSVTICVTDTVSNLSDCKYVNVVKTINSITALTLVVASEIIESGTAIAVYSPTGVPVSLVFTSSRDIATIDNEGRITVLGNGEVTFCVEDTISGLRDCKAVNVYKTIPDTYWFRVTIPVYFTNRNINSADVMLCRADGWQNMLYGNAMVFTESGRRLMMDKRGYDESGVVYVGTTFYRELDAPEGFVSGRCNINIYYVTSGFIDNVFPGTIPSYFGAEGYNLVLSNNFKGVGEFCHLSANGDFYVPVGCKISYQNWDDLTSVTIPGPMYYYDRSVKRYVVNDAFSVPRYMLPNDDKRFDVFVPEEYMQDYLDYYEENKNNIMEHPWEGWVSPMSGDTPPDFEIPYVSSLTINGSNIVTDYGYYTYSYAPANAFRDIRWHSSDEGIVTVREDGFVKVLSEGSVMIYIEDVVSGVIEEKTIYAQRTSQEVQERFAVTYNVTSTTENTLITRGNCGHTYVDTDYFSKAELEDGTEIPLTSTTSNYRYYKFPSTGEQKVYYTVKEGVTQIENPIFDSVSAITEVVVPYGLTSIGGGMFKGCRNLVSVSLPQTIVNIGYCAFRNCPLEDVVLPSSLRFLGYCAFSLAQMKEIVIPDSVQEIEDGCFFGCDNASAITIGSGVTTIQTNGIYGAFGDTFVSSFINNSSLDEVANNYWEATIVDAIEDGLAIKNNVGIHCSRLVTSVRIPDYVTGISYDSSTKLSAFSGCTKLESVYIGSGITYINNWLTNRGSLVSVYISDSVTGISASAFTNCTALTGITIPDSVTSIGNYAFSGCTSIKNIVLGAGLTNLNGLYISGRTSLENIEIGSGITALTTYCFANCTSLKSVTLPATLSSMASYAFSGCTHLETIYSYANTNPSSNASTFTGVSSNGRLLYPSGGNYNLWLRTDQTLNQLGYYGWIGYDIL